MLKTRVLIVDDDPVLSRLAGAVLEGTRQYDVCINNHSERALEVARKFRPDLILLDVDMPVKSGGEVAAEIESDAALRGTPILFLTALVSRSEAGTPVLRGRSHYLSKPAAPASLLQAVESLARR